MFYLEPSKKVDLIANTNRLIKNHGLVTNMSKKKKNKQHSEKADTSASVTFDVQDLTYDNLKKAQVI